MLINIKGHDFDLDVTEEQIHDWQQGAMIQDVMPNLKAWERELLQTGILPWDWFGLFGLDGLADSFQQADYHIIEVGSDYLAVSISNCVTTIQLQGTKWHMRRGAETKDVTVWDDDDIIKAASSWAALGG